MLMSSKLNAPRSRARHQAGMATMIIVLMILAILTVATLFASRTAFFEQRTTTYENRARLAEQAAEYGVNLAGEYFKSHLRQIVSTKANGWLDGVAAAGDSIKDGGAVLSWASCATSAPTSGFNPCLSESNATVRAQLYWAKFNDATNWAARMSVGSLTKAGGVFDTTTDVWALLCRIDTSDAANPQCDTTPEAGNNIAVTLISTAAMAGENATATVKETWSSFSNFTPSSSVPLAASGVVEGLGNAQIVTAPNAGGLGLAASVWAASDVDFEDSSGGGVGSVSTCHLGGYLGHGAIDQDDYLTVCAGTGNTGCGCPSVGDHDFLSGHSGALKRENIDILDIDASVGDEDLPDITFFPLKNMDDNTVTTDDNLFEFIFNVGYVAEQTGCNEDNAAGCSEADPSTTVQASAYAGDDTDQDCGTGDDEDCAEYAMLNELGFEKKTCAEVNALGATADGLYYIPETDCTLKDTIGSPDNNVIVVVNQNLQASSLVLYGMLFVRSVNSTAQFTGNGHAQVFGSVVVEGDVKLAGGIDIIYYDWGAKGNDVENPPAASSFGRVAGSWFDDDQGI